MKAAKIRRVPRKKAEHALTLGAALLVLLGGLLAVSAWNRNIAASAGAGPLSGLTILVDAGHGGYDGGARCRDSGVWEKTLNLAVAQKLERILTCQGAQVVMTRTADHDLCSEPRPAGLTKKRQDMQARIALAKEHEVDLVLSIHMNEYRVRSESGPQVFYREGCDGGRLLAGCVQEAMISQLQPRKKRSAMAGDYFILQMEVPSVLVECGFVSNKEEEALLLQEDYQQRIADAITTGVIEYARFPQGENNDKKGT